MDPEFLTFKDVLYPAERELTEAAEDRAQLRRRAESLEGASRLADRLADTEAELVDVAARLRRESAEAEALREEIAGVSSSTP